MSLYRVDNAEVDDQIAVGRIAYETWRPTKAVARELRKLGVGEEKTFPPARGWERNGKFVNVERIA